MSFHGWSEGRALLSREGKAEALLLYISAEVSGAFSLQCVTNILRQHPITQLRHATCRTVFSEPPSEGFELCLLNFWCLFPIIMAVVSKQLSANSATSRKSVVQAK